VLTVLKSETLNLLEPSGPVQACNGIVLPYTLTRTCNPCVCKRVYHFIHYNYVLKNDLFPAIDLSPSDLLGAFEKLRKATAGFMSIRLSARNKSSPTERTFTNLRIFRKSVKNIKVSLKSDSSIGYFTWRPWAGIATGYELDGPGIESRWGRDFPYLSRPALGPTQPHLQ